MRNSHWNSPKYENCLNVKWSFYYQNPAVGSFININSLLIEIIQNSKLNKLIERKLIFILPALGLLKFNSLLIKI